MSRQFTLRRNPDERLALRDTYFTTQRCNDIRRWTGGIERARRRRAHRSGIRWPWQGRRDLGRR